MAEVLHLSDVVQEYISGDWGEDTNIDNSLMEVACVRGADINDVNDSKFDTIPIRYISASSLSKKGLNEGNIIIEKSGGAPNQSTGRVAYISRECKEVHPNVVCSNFCEAFSIKPEWDSRYIFYYLQFFYSTGVFFNFEGKTSGLHNLDIELAFEAIPIKIININEQRKIANILASIDKKIALNRSINANLEAVVCQLYDYWFVQFDFPDAYGRPYKSSGGKMVYSDLLKCEIPEGWKEQTIDQLFNVINDRISPDNVEKDDRYTPIEVIPRHEMSFSECSPIEEATSGLCRYSKKDILLSNRRVYFHKVCIAPFDGITRDTVIILRPKDGEKLGYVFQIVYSEHFIKYATVISNGSEQPVLSWTDAQEYVTLKPNNDLDLIYSKKVNNIIERLLENQAEITSLTRQRDELLPLLMNGQVIVE